MPHDATLRQRARETAEDLLKYKDARARRRRDPCEEEYTLALGEIPSRSKLALTGADRLHAASIRALAPEPLPPGDSVYDRNRAFIRNWLLRYPATKRGLAKLIFRPNDSDTNDQREYAKTIELITAILADLLSDPESGIVIIGERHKNGNRVAVYGTSGSRIPLEPLESGDLEGHVARLLWERGGGLRAAQIRTALIKTIPHGEQSLTTALSWLERDELVRRAPNGAYYLKVHHSDS